MDQVTRATLELNLNEDPSTVTSGMKMSCWYKPGPLFASFPKLTTDLKTDVVIVGGGIAGLTCAYVLLTKGKSVILLEDGEICSGETGRTTAHLATGLDDRYFVIASNHGKDGAKMAAESHSAAIDLIEQIVTTEKIDCEFERCDGYLMVAEGDDPTILQKEFDAARDAGLHVDFVNRVPVDSFESGPALKFPRQAFFHPTKYMAGLANSVTKLGGKIFTKTHVSEFKGGGEQAIVTTQDGFRVTGENLIVATNVPVNDRFVMISKLEPYRTYVITCRIPKCSVPAMLLWDTLEEGYHYVRISKNVDKEHDLLIVGGEDHITGRAFDAEERFQRLLAWTKKRFPQASGIADQWSGQVMEPVDDVAYIGRNPDDYSNVFIVTGDSGNGMTHGTIAAMLLSDLILGVKNPWEALYNPSRQPIKEIKEFLMHNIKTQLQFKDWIHAKQQVKDIEDIPKCGGGIIRNGLKQVAVYRDENGCVHACSAVCPHLGGIVAWNDLEKSWDCPVHGSRYDRFGHVINGPANSGLSKEVEFESKIYATQKEKIHQGGPPLSTVCAEHRR